MEILYRMRINLSKLSLFIISAFILNLLYNQINPINAEDTPTYDCSNPYYNDKRLDGCTNCEDRCGGSITYNACISWCEGNNYCKGCTSNTSEEDKDNQTYVIIEKIKGDVEVSIEGEEYKQATEGMKLTEGDYISTGFESEAVIQIEQVGYTTVHEMTTFAISQLTVENNAAKTIFKLQQGSMHSVITPNRRIKANFEIITPTSTVGVRGTEFTVQYDSDDDVTTLSVDKGTVSFSDKYQQNEIQVKANSVYTMDKYGNIIKISKRNIFKNVQIVFLLIVLFLGYRNWKKKK